MYDKDYYIPIDNPEHNENVQRFLMSLGYDWSCSSGRVKYLDQNIRALTARRDMIIRKCHLSIEEANHNNNLYRRHRELETLDLSFLKKRRV